jgi:hypothetical protein
MKTITTLISLLLSICICSCSGVAVAQTTQNLQTTQTTAPSNSPAAQPIVQIAGNTIRGYAFADLNGDGKWEPIERGLPGITIALKGPVTASTTTALDGSYAFPGLQPGQYTVSEPAVSGEKITTVASYTVTVTAAPQTIGVKNFGNLPVVAATQATTFPTSTLPGSGIPVTVQSVYHAGQAPATAFFDASNLASVRVRNSVAWNFGDASDIHPDPRSADPLATPGQYPPVDANAGIVGPVAAHLYRSVGTYTATATTLDGVQHAVTVIVDPDTRQQIYFDGNGSDSNTGADAAHPLLSAAKFLAVCNGSNVHVHATKACKFSLPNCIQLCSNIVIDTGGATINPPPGGTAFAGWPGRTADVVILDASIDSPGTTTTSGTHPFIAAVLGTQFCNLRGQRISIIGGSIGCLDRAIQISDDGTDGTLLHGITQTNPWAINSQCIYSGAGSHLCEYFLTLTGSNAESPCRNDGDNTMNGLSTLYCSFSQPTPAKAGFVNRAGNHSLFARNYVGNAEASWCVGIGDPGQTINVRVTDVGVFENVCRQAPGMGDAAMSIKPGVAGLTLDYNDIQRIDGGPVVPITTVSTISPMPAPTDIIIGANNVYRGSFTAPAAVVGVTVQTK